MELYLMNYGAYLHKKGKLFEVEIEGKKKQFSPEKISSVILTNAATITTDAIQMAMEYNIDIVFLDEFGDPYGRVWYPKLGSTTYIRRKQLEVYTQDEGLEFVKTWVLRKCDNQQKFIKLLLSKRPDADDTFYDHVEKMKTHYKSLESISEPLSVSSNSIMGYEGIHSRFYFQSLSKLIPRQYQFEGRSARPAKDAFNAFLNYGYGILYTKVEKALIIAGLDPFVGLLHTDNYNKKSLVFDFIEPYRYLIDRPVFYLFSRSKVNESHYEPLKNGIKISSDGKKLLASAIMEHFDTKIRYGKRNIKNIDQIQSDAHSFGNYLIGKKDIFIEEEVQ
ncbi:MAG TPA: CRISPR-associated endonuclease Cas1 [Candidatus Cloacimonadota bacterium]|jgi:CRISPR-associated protein Cas1|nr:CRISPR-associated endonuclease Cas1 [Candidatus Cloacimonadales bacterium]HOE91062.1 CRISPR-associated endonuclease Cas1 [Candidatus Cloacimonadota bacterium]HPY97215.1 CRISPR-associated endonuclease Cas1 [Candidatus Cloacimonadota bacterium]